MKDGGVLIFIIAGLLSSLQFIANFILDPYQKMKEGKKAEFSRGKITFTVIYTSFWILFLIIRLIDGFEYHNGY